LIEDLLPQLDELTPADVIFIMVAMVRGRIATFEVDKWSTNITATPSTGCDSSSSES
jgi:hypothetical protein